MFIHATRFGSVPVKPEDVVMFPNGLIGYETCRQWVLLADQELDFVGWLQSVTHPDIAMAAISPRPFLPDYQVHVGRSQLAPLELASVDQAFILNLLANNNGRLTVNLRAPLIINLSRRLGRQVITSDDQPMQYELPPKSARLRKSA